MKEAIPSPVSAVPARHESPAAPDLALFTAPRWLVARFSEEHVTASWAIVGGGIGLARAVAWHHIHERELSPPVDAAELLARRLAENGHGGAVGLLTSRRLEAYVDVAESHGDVSARCIATVGLSNALRAGDAPGVPARSGTINILCRVSVGLDTAALLEALALAAEAKALAVREADVRSRVSGLSSSGTGTDCIVIAAPAAGAPARHAGKHTVIGHLVGGTVRAAIATGVEDWLRERGGSAA